MHHNDDEEGGKSITRCCILNAPDVTVDLRSAYDTEDLEFLIQKCLGLYRDVLAIESRKKKGDSEGI